MLYMTSGPESLEAWRQLDEYRIRVVEFLQGDRGDGIGMLIWIDWSI